MGKKKYTNEEDRREAARLSINRASKKYYYKNQQARKDKGARWRGLPGKKDIIKDTRDKYMSTINGCFRQYRANSKVRNIPFCLSLEEFTTFWQKPCHYCDEAIETIGLDRVKNDLGYVVGNIEPCCAPCNIAKRADTQEKYIARCIRVANKFSGGTPK
jgi:hypothetical protein